MDAEEVKEGLIEWLYVLNRNNEFYKDQLEEQKKRIERLVMIE